MTSDSPLRQRPILLSISRSANGTPPREELSPGHATWSVPAFLDTGLGCQLAKFPIS
jgi:hypothetical protein